MCKVHVTNGLIPGQGQISYDFSFHGGDNLFVAYIIEVHFKIEAMNSQPTSKTSYNVVKVFVGNTLYSWLVNSL